MKKYVALTVVLIAVYFTATAQYKIKSSADIDWYENIAQEKIQILTNLNTYLVGEELLYTVHCFNALSNRYSKNSKIAYIALIGENGEVFRHKMKLENGLAHGYFLLPAELKTGNYILTGYTRWMLNGGDAQPFKMTIQIINPYEPIDFTDANTTSTMNLDTKDTSKGQLWLYTDKEQYGSREAVTLELNTKGTGILGNYSVSVHKADAVNLNEEAQNEYASNPSTLSQKRTIGDIIYLPEFQGEMVTGVVLDKTTNQPAPNVPVMLSVLSNEAFQAISRTNDQGVFYIHLKKEFSDTKSMVQVLGDKRSNYNIKLNQQPTFDVEDFTFKPLEISAETKNAVLKRSVDNQVKNAYKEVGANSLNLPKYPDPFYGNYAYTFVLDDYKRFKTVAETLIEVVEHAWHERKNGKQRFINVREREHDPYYGEDILPMLIVDGALVQDHELVMNIDADLVESISVYRDEYYYEDIVYQGAVWIQTFDKDYYKYLAIDDFIEVFDRDAPQLRTSIFSPDYSTAQNRSRVPDLRHQLHWSPTVQLNGKKEKITFYTSDNTGWYEIKVRGFTNTGESITVSKYISVE